MDVIVEKVLTPEWLIEGTLFILLASVIPRISKYIFALLRKYVRRYEARRLKERSRRFTPKYLGGHASVDSER